MSKDCTDEFLEKSRKEWEAYLGKSLSLEATREIVQNISGVFRLLDKWDKALKVKGKTNE